MTARQFDINDLDRQSLDSVRTGKSLVFPNHKDVEVLTCTPPRKETFIKMEDTFWSKKRQLIPDYSVMEKIDKHVLTVGSCLFLIFHWKRYVVIDVKRFSSTTKDKTLESSQ